MAEQLKAEQEQIEAERERQAEALVQRYTGIIKQRVQRSWFRPRGARTGLSCTVQVSLLPDGTVKGVEVVESSGDEVFDRSVEKAVYRASPLPLPPDKALFETVFRNFNFRFNPQD
jgi:colicin import membrane protein